MVHRYYDPDNTGHCQARIDYLGIPGAVEALCGLTPETHARWEELSRKVMDLARRESERMGRLAQQIKKQDEP